MVLHRTQQKTMVLVWFSYVENKTVIFTRAVLQNKSKCLKSIGSISKIARDTPAHGFDGWSDDVKKTLVL